jgi:hypothetical protein
MPSCKKKMFEISSAMARILDATALEVHAQCQSGRFSVREVHVWRTDLMLHYLKFL